MEKPGKKDWSDRVNPVLVKEIRQHFHNFGILTVMGALLAAELILLVAMQYQMTASHSEFTGFGAVMFGFLAGGMTLAAFLICSLGTLIRFTAERRSRELDFSFLTVLSPNRIVWGKLAGTLVMTVFLFSLCLPFMVIAYFLRGIGMVQMLLIALALLPLIGIASQFGILVGAAGRRWLISLFFLASFFFAQPLGVAIILLFTDAGGVDSPFGAMLLWYGISGIVLEVLYALTVAAVGARFSNRMLPVRISLIAAVGLSPLIGLGVGVLSDTLPLWKPALAALGIAASGIAGFCATLAAFERLDPGTRVLRGRPRNPVGRFAHFLVSSGGWGGVALAFLLMLLATAAAAALYLADPIFGGGMSLWIAAGCYFLFYADVAILAARRWKILPGWGWWIVALVVFVVLPLLFGGLFALIDKTHAALYFATTPFCLVGFDSAGKALAWVGPLLAVVSLAFTGAVMLKPGRKS